MTERAVEQHAAGELRIPEGVGVYMGSPNGARRSVGIVVGRFNGDITSRLLDGALEALGEAGVPRERIDVMPVPGAFELPLGAMAFAKTRRYACVIQLAGLETGVPVAFGLLTCDSRRQAEERAGGEKGNKGTEAARTALEMADALSRLRASIPR